MFADSNHNETIYNIVPPKFIPQEKPPMHRSSHSSTLPPTASTFHQIHSTQPLCSNVNGKLTGKPVADKSHSTFGKQQGSYTKDPNDYTKKFSKSQSVPSLSEVKRTNPEILKPKTLHPTSKRSGGPPKKEEIPVMNLVTSKNFIVANAVETILAQPKKLPEAQKDYLKKEDYGKVPKYLTQIKNDIDAEYDYIRQLELQRQEMEALPVRPLDDGERISLINGLKAKWDQVNTEYQGGTHVTKLDTKGKIKRKEQQEAQLSLIEKDIERLSKKNIQINMAE